MIYVLFDAKCLGGDFKFVSTSSFESLSCCETVLPKIMRKHENMSTCTGSRVNTSYARIASSAGTQFRTQAQSLKATPPPAIVPRVLTIRPWPVRQKRMGSSRMVSHTRHSSELILGRNDSPQSCLHLPLTCRYFCTWETWEQSPCDGSRVNTSFERIASSAGTQFRTRAPE